MKYSSGQIGLLLSSALSLFAPGLASAQSTQSFAQIYTCTAKSLRMAETVVVKNELFIPGSHLKKMDHQFQIIEISGSSINGFKNPLMMYGAFDLQHNNEVGAITDLLDPSFVMPKGDQPGNKINLDLNVLRRTPLDEVGMADMGIAKLPKKEFRLKSGQPSSVYEGISMGGFADVDMETFGKFLNGTGATPIGEIMSVTSDQITWYASLILPDSFTRTGSQPNKFVAKLIFRNTGGSSWNQLALNKVELTCSKGEGLSEADLKTVVSVSGAINIEEIPELTGSSDPGDGSAGQLNWSVEPQWQTGVNLFGLSAISFNDMAQLIGSQEVKMHVVTLTSSAILASAIIQGYRLLGLGGKQKVLSAIVPPGIVNDWMGRSGYRIPPHSRFNEQDLKILAAKIKSIPTEQKQESYLQTLDPELVSYFRVASDYVRRAQGLKFTESCPVSDQCI